MTVLFIILKILGTILLLLSAFGIAIALGITNWSLKWLSKNGRKITGKVVGTKVISNKNCNSLPGYHYRIEYEFQRHDVTFSGAYTPWWRYLSKRTAQKNVNIWPV
jgi:hypothetical protein